MYQKIEMSKNQKRTREQKSRKNQGKIKIKYLY